MHYAGSHGIQAQERPRDYGNAQQHRSPRNMRVCRCIVICNFVTVDRNIISNVELNDKAKTAIICTR